MTTAPSDLLAAADNILPNSYARYSGFCVAASLRASNGKIYAGVNVENASYSLTCCAEKTAVAAMAADGERQITELLVLVPGPQLCPPCGACLQMINEFSNAECRVHLCTQEGDYRQLTMAELLPYSFGSDNLKGIS